MTALKKHILLLLSIFLLISSCQKEVVPSVVLSQTEIKVSSVGGSQAVLFESNVNWTATSSAVWCTVSNASGDVSIKGTNVIIAANDTYDSRNCTITITAGTISKSITITQSQLDAIIFSTKSFDVLDTAVVLSVELSSNVQYMVNIPVEAKSWISQRATKSLIKENLQFSIERNYSHEKRSAQIIVKQPMLKLADTLVITQDKAPYLPSLATTEASDISLYSAKSGGTVSNDGGALVLARGVCWSTLENPTIQNFKTSDGFGVGTFTSNILELNAATKYYVRAYATNRSGTSYGNQITFTTISIVASPVITPKGGVYTVAQTVSISCATDGAEIRYTLDGSEPKTTSALYNGAININSQTTLKAKAFKTNWIESSVVTETYIINIGATVIEGSSTAIQYVNATNNFIFRLNNLNDKSVYFVFSNKNRDNSTALPQVYSNVVYASSADKSVVFSEQTFVVSGKPHISEFNNDPWKFPMEGITKSQYQEYSLGQPEKLVLGSSEIMYDDIGVARLSTVRKVVSAHGKSLYIWVDNECWGAESTKKYYVTQEMVDALAPKFLDSGQDNDIYEWVTSICGAPWGYTGYSNLIKSEDDIHIWLTDIDNDNTTTGTVTLGYFYSRDNFLRSSIAKSNEKLMFTLDAVLFASKTSGIWSMSNYWPKHLVSTLAHEFTHMIYYYQKRILKKQIGNTAINEMCAQCVEDLVASKMLADGPRGVSYVTPNAGGAGNRSGRLPLYNSSNEYTLLNWSGNESERLLNYSKTYALGAYLMRNYGGVSLIKELIQNNSTGVSSIEEAVNSNGGVGLKYEDILQKFGAANLLSDQTTVNTGSVFNTGTWITSTVNGIAYDLGSINLYNYTPTPYIYTELPGAQQPGSNIYYRAGSNLNGTKEWSFVGMSADTKLTVVIK